jgi:hypothetical protein
LLVSVFIESQEKAPEQIILDVDTTDLPLHGKEGLRQATAICRCIFSAENTFCARDCGKPTVTLRPEAWRRLSGSSGRFEQHGRK